MVMWLSEEFKNGGNIFIGSENENKQPHSLWG